MSVSFRHPGVSEGSDNFMSYDLYSTNMCAGRLNGHKVFVGKVYKAVHHAHA